MKNLALVIIIILLSPMITNMVYAQEQEQEKRKYETITIPYTAANAVFLSPERYEFPTSHLANWILNIQNNLEYNEKNPEAKIVLRLKENPEDMDFVEIAMLTPPSNGLWIAVANEEVGYMRLYENTHAWFTDKSISASFVQNDRLSVNNGQRIVLDRLRIGPFTLDTVELYGREDSDADVSALGGELVLSVLSGNPLDNPILMIPPIVAVVTAAIILTLLIIKKRT